MENSVNLPAACSKSLELELTLSMFCPKKLQNRVDEAKQRLYDTALS